ncbi:MAG: fibronectin type III domain-containing protein [Eubacterium sp.]|nr:fibronectin type III domain-containing protein [Eubacterium sp.]
MKKAISILLSLVLLLCSLQGVQFSALADGTMDVVFSVEANYTYANDVFNKVNAERASAGLSALGLDKDLCEAATKRAAELIIKFSHYRPDGSKCFTATSKMLGENICAGYSTPDAAMTAWMNSTGHRNNILKPEWQSIGVGCIHYNGMYYWAQAFSSYTPESVSLSGVINTNVIISTALDNISMSFKLDYNGTNYVVSLTGENLDWDEVKYPFNNSFFDFYSSDESVFKVDSSGNIIAVGGGTATLKVTSKQNPSVTFEKTLTVITGSPLIITYTSTGPVFNPSNGKGTAETGPTIVYTNGKTSNGNSSSGSSSGSNVTVTLPSTSIKKLTKGKKSIKVTWKKKSKVAGYQIQLATNKKFSKNKKSVTVKKAKATSKTVKKLKANKKYFVRIRTYKVVNGKKAYSKWSTVKTVKTK